MRICDDEVGGIVPPGAYTETGAIDRPCPLCKAPPKQKCTFVIDGLGAGNEPRQTTLFRHIPCLPRLFGNNASHRRGHQ